MVKIKYIKGDMIEMMKDPEQLKIPTIYIHGCNCHVAMNSGIAGGISKSFPKAVEADKRFQKLFVTRGEVDMGMLGNYSYIKLDDKANYLINLYTQYFPGPDFRIDALEDGFTNLVEDFGYEGYRLVFPKIGAGIGGGDWNMISNVIENTISDEGNFTEVICVEWNKQ